MELIVDLHIHSRFARATSKSLTLPNIYKWCKIKGINVIGTGDFTHPVWFSELKEHLEEAEGGLYKLKDKFAKDVDQTLPQSVKNNTVRFIPTVEISNIYKRRDKVRRLHNVIIADSLKSALKINQQLDKIGNLKSDGRPILGLDSEKLLELTYHISENNLFIPAHIWTPWFAMFGSRSGFDTIVEAFGKNAHKIVAVETGLSSDPFMNWRLDQLKNITLVSNSDAHSLPKMAREANLINSKLTYTDIIGAIKTNDKRFVGTIEFFPEEGMYHLDGHKKCKFKSTPLETKKLNGICPKCKKPLVVGVEYRVDELANKPENYIPKSHKKVEYIVPLIEIIAECEKVKSTSGKKVLEIYDQLIAQFGDEFKILRHINPQKISENGFQKLGHAIDKLRKKDLFIDPGYDGTYGVVKIFKPNEDIKTSNQLGLGI